MFQKQSLFVKNIGQLVTFAPLIQNKRLHSITEADLGILTEAWILIENGMISQIGSGPPPQLPKQVTHMDAQQRLILPGLIDSHTHPVFAGSRAKEFVQRLAGVSYQQIAENGGGINATVKATRQATDKELSEKLQNQFQRWLKLGVTTLEAKSGYGLSAQEELRHLRILQQQKQKTKQHITTTCLALHALPPGTDKQTFINEMTETLLPQVATNKLADWVDAFIETGYFSAADCQPYFRKAKELGLGIRIHADEFSDAEAATTAAQYSAASADHLQFSSTSGLRAMAQKNVVATLLPGTSLYTKLNFTQAQALREAGCAIAVATDFNPGSCLLDNLANIATMAAIHCGLNHAEALAAVTLVAAASLRLQNKKGALAPGFDADFCMYELNSPADWLADAGKTLPQAVWIQGELCHSSIG